MEDTWTSRDLPVLDAAVRLLEQGNVAVSVGMLAADTGLEPQAVARALDALEGPYVVEFRKTLTGGNPLPWYITRVTSAARQAVGQWPTPEVLIDRLAEGFRVAAEHESDPKRRSRLREVASVLGDTGRDLAVEVAARVILRQAGMG